MINIYLVGKCIREDNVSIHAYMQNGMVSNSAYLGKYGNDEVAECVQETLKKLEIDDTHCRHFQGENGFALVTLKETDRVFLGSNKGGIAKDHAFDFNEEDMDYIQQYDLIYTNLNSYIEQDLSKLYQTKVPIAYDFSMRWTDEYLRDVCPYVTVAIMSCAHLSEDEREREMKKAQKYGVSVVTWNCRRRRLLCII